MKRAWGRGERSEPAFERGSPRARKKQAWLCSLGTACILAYGAASGCDRVGDPRPQWKVNVGTDAGIPGLGDRLRVDIVDEDGNVCDECTRIFDIDASTLPLSFGVVQGSNRKWVRARIFRAEAIDIDGEPLPPFLEVLGELPALGAEPMDVSVLLTMDCFGRQADPITKSSCDPSTLEETTSLVFPEGGADTLPQPGSWRFGEEPCDTDPPEGMICVPGGTFLLGNAIFRPFGPDFDPVPQQLVHVSPFLLDIDEMTVAKYRPLVDKGVPPPGAESTQKFCAYTTEPGPNEGASVNCMTRDHAAQACAALGKRLPTEAEWEFAAGGGALEASYPWAIPDPTASVICAQAVIGRADFDSGFSRQCVEENPGLAEGPQIGGAESDVNYLGAKNMAGNLEEWTADNFVYFSDEACWGDDLELRDNPRCDADSVEGTVRGGSFVDLPYDVHPFFRRGLKYGTRWSWVGIRCAKSLE